NNAELTKEKFTDNPFCAEEKLYVTGDIARWLPDGNIEFTGRKDDQVKIRGYRIEPGEIANTLQNYPSINDAIVIAKENSGKEKELVAYITAKEEQNINELRSYLKKTLPEYMIPEHFVQLQTLPLTVNGKIDKKSLPDPQGLGIKNGTEYVAPRNETEEKLIKLWEVILQRNDIGVQDDFFALGGHSLKAIRLIMAIKSEFNVKLDIKILFLNTTVELLAQEVERISWLLDVKKTNSSANIIEI
ncbi:MAG: non-ribosomal peptide synthetase, partial [Bacteroidia bacterium]|nr:non-ribosomal peptide synthetase [Bacteroidia bacterium]